MDPVEGLLSVLFPQTPGPISGPHSWKVNKSDTGNSVHLQARYRYSDMVYKNVILLLCHTDFCIVINSAQSLNANGFIATSGSLRSRDPE